MADPIHGLTTRAANQVGQVVRKVLRTLPETGRRTRRVIGNNRGGSIDFSSSGACACCNCLECVRRANASVDECAACPRRATKRYAVILGAWTAFPELTVYSDTATPPGIRLTHLGGTSCLWESADTSVTRDGDTGVYKWRLTQAGASTSLELVFVSGVDVIQIDTTSFAVEWLATDAGSCLCERSMKATNPDQFPCPAGLFCTICLIPIADTTCQLPDCLEDGPAWMDITGITGTGATGPVDFPLRVSAAGLGDEALVCCQWGATATGPDDLVYSLTIKGDGGGFAAEIRRIYYTPVFGERREATEATYTATLTGDCETSWEFVLDDPIVSGGLHCDEIAGYVGIDTTLTWTSSFTLTGAGGTSEPQCPPYYFDGAGGGEGTCEGSRTYFWNGDSVWEQDTTANVGTCDTCETGTCSAPVPSRDGAYLNERVVVPCNCY